MAPLFFRQAQRRAVVQRLQAIRVQQTRSYSSAMKLLRPQVFAFLPLASQAFTTTQHYSSTSRLAAASDDDAPFPSWTFDDPSSTMELSPLCAATLSVGGAFKGDSDADLIVLGVPAPPKKDDEEEEEKEETVELEGVIKTVDESLNGALSDVLTENLKGFFGKAGSMTPTLRMPSSKQRFIVMGTGGEDDKDGIGFTLGKSVASKLMEEKKVGSVHVVLPSAAKDGISNFATALYQTLHADNRFRTGKNVKKVAEDLKSIELFIDEAVDPGAIETGKNIASGVLLAKDIVNAPHNVLNSLSLADTAQKIADASPCMEIEILDKKECEEAGMGAFLGVARGSETEPKFIHLTYKPADGKVNQKVGVIGKGLLFDTGGYNIKTQMMQLMKFDCGGAAAVLGAARAVGALAPPGVEAHFVVAACENMINEKAYVPSDILQASNGKTIEILNTDAEGRLTLADALVYCDKTLECEKIIELSTLTGACMVALGQKICGLWTENDDLAEELLDAAKVTGDSSWRMPMAKEYNEQLESKIADLKNIGGPYGGSITAALFLQNFVEGKKPFAHLDIAGPVWDEKIGATGFGAKLVVEWVKQQGKP